MVDAGGVTRLQNNRSVVFGESRYFLVNISRSDFLWASWCLEGIDLSGNQALKSCRL